MRNQKRIPQILERLQKVWEKHPDLRLGQLIENCFKHDDDVNTGFPVFPSIMPYVIQESNISKAKELDDFLRELFIWKAKNYGKHSWCIYGIEDEEFIKRIEQFYNKKT